MKIRNIVLMMVVLSMLIACGKSKPKPPQITEEDFLTLADVGGRTTLKEDSPDVRVINVKAKAMIKKHNLREAKKKAMTNAAKMAVDSMVRELMTTENYNKKYAEIERYFSKNIDKYILDRQAAGERKIYMDKYYGVYASFKISRQKVLVALQKDLKFIDASGSTLITVITSKKDLDLSGAGYRFSDVENMLMNQIQTDLNQRGLRAMDFRNAISSMQIDERKKRAFAKISKEQFMAAISGSKPGAAAFNSQVKAAEELYATVGKWILRVKDNVPKTKKQTDPGQHTEVFLPELVGFDTVSGLTRLGGNTKLYQSLLVNFYQDNQGFSQEINQAFAQNDMALVHRLVHTIKGVSGNIGAQDLQAAAIKLEFVLRKNNLDEIQVELESFNSELKVTISRLKELVEADDLAKFDGLEKKTGDVATLLNLLKNLEYHLAMREPKPSSDIITEIISFNWSDTISPTLIQLSQSIARYRFEDAQQLSLSLTEAIEETRGEA